MLAIAHPGRYRPGLIEAGTRARPHQRRRRHPGRYRPGLIEAVNRIAPGVDLPAHPGRYRPGLIEARAQPPPERQRAGHPGRYRPGLIEAYLVTAWISSQACIRGDIAPASLKRRRRRRLDHQLPPRIRGDIAPASLKPRGHAAPSLRRVAHPGRYRPGLIEASSSGRTRLTSTRIRGDIAPASLKLLLWQNAYPKWKASGAISPRPH